MWRDFLFLSGNTRQLTHSLIPYRESFIFNDYVLCTKRKKWLCENIGKINKKKKEKRFLSLFDIDKPHVAVFFI